MTNGRPVSEIRIGELIRGLSVPQLWRVGVAIVVVLGGAFGLGVSVNGYRLERVQDELATTQKRLKEIEGEKAQVREPLVGIERERAQVGVAAVQTQVGDIGGQRAEEPQVASRPAGGESRSAPPAGDALPLSDVPPFPKGFDDVRPGSRLSEAVRLHPGGDLGVGYVAQFDQGPFFQVHYVTIDAEADPVIRAVVFTFRTRQAASDSLTGVLRTLSSQPHRVEALGSEAIWPNINGYSLRIDASNYRIRKAE